MKRALALFWSYFLNGRDNYDKEKMIYLIRGYHRVGRW